MKTKNKKQKGFMLVGTLIVSIVLLLLCFAVLKYSSVDADMVARSKVNANLQAALDTGLDRAINMLNTGSNWNTPSTLTGFRSLSWTPYTEIQNTKYYVMILDGAKDVTYSAKLLTHASAQLLTNTGDSFYDRTILVRAVDTVNSITVTAQGNIHRNDLVPPSIIGGVTTSGNLDLNNMDFESYDSCTGIPPGGASGCSGTVQGSPAGGGGTGLCSPLPMTSNVTPVALPTVVAPVGALPVPPNTLVTQNWSGTTTLGPGVYQCANISGNNVNMNFNTCSGTVTVYVTGTFDVGGSSNFVSGCPPTGAGHPAGGSPAKATVYVLGNTVSFSGNSTMEILLYAPTADVDVNGGGNGSFYGAIVSKTFSGGSSSSFDMHFDACLLRQGAADHYLKPPVVTSRWKIIP